MESREELFGSSHNLSLFLTKNSANKKGKEVEKSFAQKLIDICQDTDMVVEQPATLGLDLD